ncbi:acyl-CoA dehydrogenase family protein [Phenylobacterium sp.]|jgi:alkylation response protein AidB-like acyl-CoA dehydrogenase|uniref:acyl-CoA dehydrogenase family protein n=1 Tax=Phenylobacterium sp. TaxID=1871053 RepID=UPI002F3FCA50
MDFEDTPEEGKYRAQVRAWIAANAPDVDAIPPGERRYGEPRHKATARAWQAAKAAAGYACIDWPEAWGGLGGTPIQQAIFNQEEVRAGASFSYFMTGLNMLLPALLQFADKQTTDRLVPPAMRGEEIWCQLFSEPSNGSDAAAARCRAVRDGGDWVIDGQKVWNSAAHYADYGLLLARTDPDAPKHKGLTMFWLRMDTPGVEVRPIHQMSGGADFNEVFLTDVRIPDSQRVGDVGQGWKVTVNTLMNERAALGGGSGLSWRDIERVARATPGVDRAVLRDPAFRERLADWYVTAEAIRLLSLRTLTTLSKGGVPGPESSAGKLLWSSQTQDLSNQAVEIQDEFGVVDDPAYALDGAAFQHRLLFSPGLRLGGGTDEILRNIIAERVLGLPGDVRLDKDVPFRDVPTGR